MDDSREGVGEERSVGREEKRRAKRHQMRLCDDDGEITIKSNQPNQEGARR